MDCNSLLRAANYAKLIVHTVPSSTLLPIVIVRPCFSISNFVRYNHNPKLFESLCERSACQNLSHICSKSFGEIHFPLSVMMILVSYKLISIVHQREVNLYALSKIFFIIIFRLSLCVGMIIFFLRCVVNDMFL